MSLRELKKIFCPPRSSSTCPPCHPSAPLMGKIPARWISRLPSTFMPPLVRWGSGTTTTTIKIVKKVHHKLFIFCAEKSSEPKSFKCHHRQRQCLCSLLFNVVTFKSNCANTDDDEGSNKRRRHLRHLVWWQFHHHYNCSSRCCCCCCLCPLSTLSFCPTLF